MPKQVINLTPDQAVLEAVALCQRGDNDTAEKMLRAVIKIDIDRADAQLLLGSLLAGRKDYYEALYRFDRALLAQYNVGQALSNKGMVVSELGHLEEAAALFKEAIGYDNNNAVFWNNLGNVLERLWRYPEALEALNEALRLDPKHTLSYSNRGGVLARMGRHHEAIANFNRAIALDPDNADAHYNRGIANLTLGNLKQGFADYEWRTRTNEGQHYYVGPFEQPRWAGKADISGKTLLIHGEQGLGDTIQFMRYVPMLLERDVKIVMHVHEPLQELVRAHFSEPNVRFVAPAEKYPPFDYWIPIMSQPFVFGTAMESIPPPWDLSCYRHMPNPSALQIGVCWSGNWQHKNDANRSIPLDIFKDIFSVSGCDFIRLQKDVRLEDADAFEGLRLRQPVLASMVDTAKEIGVCDLVITVDTAVAHLAGSVGTPTWVLLPAHTTDWRWMRNRSDTPWYPKMALFRQDQTKGGTWPEVLENVSASLAILARNKAA